MYMNVCTQALDSFFQTVVHEEGYLKNEREKPEMDIGTVMREMGKGDSLDQSPGLSPDGDHLSFFRTRSPYFLFSFLPPSYQSF